MWQASTICRATVVSSVLCLPDILNGGVAGGGSDRRGVQAGRRASGSVCRLTRLRGRYVDREARANRRGENDTTGRRSTAAVLPSPSPGSTATATATAAVLSSGSGSAGSTPVVGGNGTTSASRSLRGLGACLAGGAMGPPPALTLSNGFSAMWHADVSARACARDGSWEPAVTCLVNHDQPARQAARGGGSVSGREVVLRLSLRNGAARESGSGALRSGGDGTYRDRGYLTLAAAAGPTQRDGGAGSTIGETGTSVGGGGSSGGGSSGGYGGDGGRGGSDGGDGVDGGDGGAPRKLLMSQVFSLTYAVLLAVGGLIGFVKGRSVKSLAAGVGAGIILLYVSANLPMAPLYASSVGLAVAAILSVVMGKRYLASKKMFPGGITALYSLFMSVGYIHGLARARPSP
ncbi:hypothetical protein CBR_g16036 [Chara braunii]|uniref:Uncharacterized protein n=1 Tax=Chara braunii TaxID=69332 RepID=A0A388JT01_CHABU|nr:hypothetical protein CBR_g16036 [Chara braunii]|eukprot:GBG60915.1 hypothetical protein CBR_g16036 [Chara braunii]